MRELRLRPADVERRHHVEEQVGRDAAGIIPILAETEEAIGIKGALRRRPQPRLPIDVVVTLAVGPGTRINVPVPFAFHAVAKIVHGCFKLDPRGAVGVEPAGQQEERDDDGEGLQLASLSGNSRKP